MTSTNYRLEWDTLGFGGGDAGSSTSYQLRDTGGNLGAGNSLSTSYALRAGYRQGIFDEFLEFSVQALSASTSVAVSNLSGSTITVSSASGFSQNDLVMLVQDNGQTGVAAFGKVASTSSTTVVLDSLVTVGGTPSIDGPDDYLYLLNGTTAAFGTLSGAYVDATGIGWEVSTASNSGYTVSVIEDGDLRTGANSIADVSDGAVSAGSSEYGARSSDASLTNSTFDTQDTAFTSDFREVATESSPGFDRVNGLLLKASFASGAAAGDYAHTISFIASGNY